MLDPLRVFLPGAKQSLEAVENVGSSDSDVRTAAKWLD